MFSIYATPLLLHFLISVPLLQARFLFLNSQESLLGSVELLCNSEEHLHLILHELESEVNREAVIKQI